MVPRVVLLSLLRTYHDYVRSRGSEYTPPDLAVAFNPEIGNLETESWFPTVQLLIAKKIPSMFTVRLMPSDHAFPLTDDVSSGEQSRRHGGRLQDFGQCGGPPCPWTRGL